MEESNFYDLRKQVVQQLRERHYAPLTICAFKSSYNKLECYMMENKIEIDEDLRLKAYNSLKNMHKLGG